MTDLRKAAETALQVLENKRLRSDEHIIAIVVDDLRQALAQPQQKPVAAVELITIGSDQVIAVTWHDSNAFKIGAKLYIEPQSKKWVSLTDEEISKTVGSPLDEVYLEDFRRVMEKLKDKNNETV